MSEPKPESAFLLSSAGRFAAEQLEPNAARWDELEEFPVETLKLAGKLGFGCLFVNPENGGCGLSRHVSAQIFEILSAGCVSTAAYLSVHNTVASLVDRFGTDAQRMYWLPHLTSMQWLGSYCQTEAQAGSDIAAIQTRAVRDGDFYVVDGAKQFISGAGAADCYITLARTSDYGSLGLSMLLIHKATPGLCFGRVEHKLGWRSQPTGEVTFCGCRVPACNLLGAEGDGFSIAMAALDGARVNIAACSIGPAASALKLASQYASQRKQFGKPIGDNQAIQFKLADMATEIEAARALMYRAARSIDEDATDQTMRCAMAKQFATEAGLRAVDAALQIHGAYGYTRSLPLERWLRDVRVHQILEGTNEIMRIVIARAVMREQQRTT